MVKRKLRRKIYKKHPRLFLALKIVLGGFLLSLLFISALFLYFAKDLPRPEVFTEKPFVLPTEIYDREGRVLLYQIYDEEKRTVVPLSQVPESLKSAVITAEDSNFYHHFGLDINGILRSVLKNLSMRNLVYGGSTISQQLIRSSFLSTEKTARRKIKEIILTLELERRYSKDKILEFYLNQIPFGANAYGVEAAAQVYFSKPVSEISLSQAAALAALIRAPSRLSLAENREELISIRNYILRRMAQNSYISEDESQKSQNEILQFAEIRHPIKAPHFVLYVKNYLEENYPDYFLKTGGLKVFTTLDWQLQQLAEEIVKNGVKINEAYNAHNASLVAIDPNKGEILAMVGSADYFGESYPKGCVSGSLDQPCLFDPKVNAAVYGRGRQPGSSFKPFVYYLALKNGITPETVLWDVKTEFNPDCDPSADQEKDKFGMDCYHPNNYDEKFRGPITLKNALAQSINLPAVEMLYLVGQQNTLDLAHSLGITTLQEPASYYGLSLVLGGGEVKLLDITSAYGTFASRGLKTPPVSIIKISDTKGNIIEENKKTPKRVLDPKIVDKVSNILSDDEARAPIFGYRGSLYIPGHQVAVKTGTTQEYKDAWTIGYTNSLVVGVWAGNNDSTPIERKSGVAIASPIWNKFIKKALELYPSKNFIEPEPTLAINSATSTHSILYYLKDKPEIDPQYQNWEIAIQNWIASSTTFH
ncbi:MAG: transglycosylase domain-containing protein [Candidatus Nealsonbacteria bacterium]|nr:transglycosylase domain-containing protein [Candidatus Nealsonbacteria bacterium]